MPATTIETLIYKLEVDDAANKIFDKTADNLSALHKAFKKLDSTTGTSSKVMTAWGKVALDVFSAVANSIASLSINAVKNFAQYEDSLSHARRTMGLTREETLELGDSMIALATSFEEGGLKANVTANDLGKIAGILGQLGFSARDDAEAFGQLTATVAKVGLAFGMSNQKAAEGLGILQNLYNLPTEQLSNIASSIAYLGNTTVATAGAILNIMTRVGGIAGILGVTAQDMAGIAATLREAGVSAQVGGTAMSQIFSRLSSDVDKFGEVLGAGGLSGDLLRMKIETGDATGALKDVLQAIQFINQTEGKIAAIQALKDLGLQGVRVQQTLLGLSNNVVSLNENLAKSDEAFRENAAINDAYNAAIDNTQQNMVKFWNVIDAIQKIIGKDLSIAFSNFLEKHLIPFVKHFQEWLMTSKGAKAIFGPDGFMAKGLQWIGEKLSEIEPLFFDWIDNIDKNVPAIIEKAKKSFGAWFQEIIDKSTPILLNIKNIITDVDNLGKMFDELKYTARATMEVLKVGGEALIQVWDLLYKGVILFFTDFSAWSTRATEAIDGLLIKFFDMLGIIKENEEAATGNSLFPDMVSWTETATDKVDTLVKSYSSLAEAIEAGDFSTDALGNTFAAMAGKANAAVAAVMQTTQASLAAVASGGGFDSATLQEMMKKPGFMSAKGLAGTSRELRARQETGLPQLNTSMPTMSNQTPQMLQATLVMNDREVGVMNSVLNTQNQQNQRRSFSGVA